MTKQNNNENKISAAGGDDMVAWFTRQRSLENSRTFTPFSLAHINCFFHLLIFC